MSATTSEAPVNVRLENRRRSSMGARARRSTATKAPSSTTPPAKSATIGALVHPSVLPRRIAKTSRNSPLTSVVTPGTSTGLGSGSRDSRTCSRAKTSTGTPRTTLSPKIARQPRPSTSAPPASGPAAKASPIVAPQIPIARARAAPWNSWASSAREEGKITAAAEPWIARAAMSAGGLGASVQAREASVNAPSPVRNSRRRPKRSARLPAVSWKTARHRA